MQATFSYVFIIHTLYCFVFVQAGVCVWTYNNQHRIHSSIHKHHYKYSTTFKNVWHERPLMPLKPFPRKSSCRNARHSRNIPNTFPHICVLLKTRAKNHLSCDSLLPLIYTTVCKFPWHIVPLPHYQKKPFTSLKASNSKVLLLRSILV